MSIKITGKMKINQKQYVKSILEKFNIANPGKIPLEAGVKF